jgi:hypothetical protein
MVNVALLVRLEAKPGKESDVAKFLRDGLAVVDAENRQPPLGLLFNSDRRHSAYSTLFQMRLDARPIYPVGSPRR